MKFASLLVTSLFLGLSVHAHAKSAVDVAPILYKISVQNEAKVASQTMGRGASAMRMDPIAWDVKECAGSIEADGKLYGHCWVHVVTYREITVAELNQLVTAAYYGQTEIVLSSSNPMGPTPAKIEKKSSAYLSMEISANADGSQAKVVVMTLE